MSQPIYKHDCVTCAFLGNDTLHDHPIDVYVCSQMGSPTIILRHGNDGPEYESWNFLFLNNFHNPSGSESYLLAYSYLKLARKTLLEQGLI